MRTRWVCCLLVVAACAAAAMPAVALSPAQAGSPDPFEPNDTPQQVLDQVPQRSFLNPGRQLDGLNFSGGAAGVQAAGDIDWFYFYAKAGANYRIAAVVQPGVDTELFVYADPPPATNTSADRLTASNDDAAAGDRGSLVSFSAPAATRYWIKVWNKDASPRTAAATYALRLDEVAAPTATPTGTAAPTRTPIPGRPDRFEYNGDFASATRIEPDTVYAGLNFMPFNAQSLSDVDNDFFALSVKAGETYTCGTFDLSPGTDTNMIVYDSARRGIGGNDDISAEETARGNVASRFTWRSAETGVAFLLVGDVQPAPANRAESRGYALRCARGAFDATPTPAALGTSRTATLTVPTGAPTQASVAVSVTATPSPLDVPTPRALANLPFRPLGAQRARGTPTKTPSAVVISVVIFADANGNGVLDAGEAVGGMAVQISDEAGTSVLDHGTTDGAGNASFAIFGQASVQVSVPALGASERIQAPGGTLRLQIGVPRVPDRWP